MENLVDKLKTGRVAKSIDHPLQFGKIRDYDKAAVIYVADWCVPCRMLVGVLTTPQIKDFVLKNGIYVFAVDHDKHKDISISKGIKGLPTMDLYRQGNLSAHVVGLKNANELISEFNQAYGL